jgi:phosphoribosylformylglycinamidine synthase I
VKAAVVVFPGSNCDHDALHALGTVFGLPTTAVWHGDATLPPVDLVVLPGGFSYGDYLRSGAIARFSPIMKSVAEHAAAGRPLLGICNGFQVLCEAGLLPGALLPNEGRQFVCKDVYIRAENTSSPFTCAIPEGKSLKIPIAHGDGRYTADEDTLARLEGEGQVAFRYVDPHGRVDAHWNPNGSLHAIAGVLSPRGNVLGLMPHPERAVETSIGSGDGRLVFESLLAAATRMA